MSSLTWLRHEKQPKVFKVGDKRLMTTTDLLNRGKEAQKKWWENNI